MRNYKITWTDSTSAGVLGAKVYRNDIEIYDAALGEEEYIDNTFELDTDYKYEVQAYTSGDETTREVLNINVLLVREDTP